MRPHCGATCREASVCGRQTGACPDGPRRVAFTASSSVSATSHPHAGRAGALAVDCEAAAAAARDEAAVRLAGEALQG